MDKASSMHRASRVSPFPEPDCQGHCGYLCLEGIRLRGSPSLMGSPRCRPGSISRLTSPTLARGERGAPGRLAGAFREVAVKGAHGGEGLETSGSAGPPYAQLGACFVREEGGVNRLRDVSKVVQPRNRRTSRGRTCRSLREDPPRSA